MLALLFSPIGKALIGAVGILALLACVFEAGVNHEKRIDQVATLKAQNATLQFDVDELTKKAAEAATDAALIEAASLANEETISADEGAFDLAYGCILPAELEWLRGIGTAGPRKGSLPTPGVLAASARSHDPGCDSWPIVAAKYRARFLTANDKLGRGRRAWQGMVDDFAKGTVSPLPAAPKK